MRSSSPQDSAFGAIPTQSGQSPQSLRGGLIFTGSRALPPDQRSASEPGLCAAGSPGAWHPSPGKLPPGIVQLRRVDHLPRHMDPAPSAAEPRSLGSRLRRFTFCMSAHPAASRLQAGPNRRRTAQFCICRSRLPRRALHCEFAPPGAHICTLRMPKPRPGGQRMPGHSPHLSPAALRTPAVSDASRNRRRDGRETPSALHSQFMTAGITVDRSEERRVPRGSCRGAPRRA